jgi:hypothetical protein
LILILIEIYFILISIQTNRDAELMRIKQKKAEEKQKKDEEKQKNGQSSKTK